MSSKIADSVAKDQKATDIAAILAKERRDLHYGQLMLRGMQKMTNLYGGTVDPVTVQERRAKNKQARKSRRINRQRRK